MICSYSKEFSDNGFTDIENVFINEYLPVSSGDAVKVYLYGLLLCRTNESKSIEQFAESIKMPKDTVIDCFTYWEEFGLINIVNKEPFEVIYLPVKSAFTGKVRKIKAEKYTEFSKSLQGLIKSRMISTNEFTEYYYIMENYGIKPEAFLMIVKSCIGRKGEDISYKYISKVAKDYGERGITTFDKVEKELSSYLLSASEITRILKALSQERQPDVEDSNYLKIWKNELNFEVDNIVYAASKIKKGSMKKLDEFLKELYSMNSFSKEEIDNFVKEKQRIFDIAVKINKALAIYTEVIDTVIDTYTKKWISYGYLDDALLYIATYCFKNEKRTLSEMDGLIEKLHELGVIDLTSVNDYFESIKKDDELITKILQNAGLSRRPTPWDRNNLASWRKWNFSDEMILTAALFAQGKSSPIQYIHGILSNWKNNGIFTISDIEQKNEKPIDNTKDYASVYEKRRANAIAKSQRNNEKAMEIEGFIDIYSRLTSMEKDLAITEINKNAEELKNLEAEKKELTVKANALLKTIGLDLTDLSPKYVCEKCHDTGFIGTHKCDCFNK